MKLSIIVPFYNAENHLDRCIKSLLNQNINSEDYEIILIDDGSVDGGSKIADYFAHAYKNISTYSQENKGLGASRNIGMRLAKGNYVYFIDSDDYLAHNTIGNILGYAQKFDLDIVGFNTIPTTETGMYTTKSKLEFRKPKVLKGEDFLVKHKYHRLEAWWYLIKREYLMKKGFKFEEGKFMEDAVFTFNIFLEADKTMFLPVDAHRYVKTHDSIMNNNDKNHLVKVIDDYISLVMRFNDLSNQVKAKQYSNANEITKSIKYKSVVSVYFMFFKILKSRLSVFRIHKMLSELKKIGVYPLKGFIGEQYNHKKFKLTAFVFNHKYLFYLSLYPIRVLYRLKLINLDL
ncbi:glycosyltransferase [Hyunsoonleella ulvae]|uniref:glycosyltransferase n=1 Tax=Hyunsoonleella ulvae TaxID=2799948 RepID=UPI0019395328|nr:glycosyltransferase [Hyunsoonleella ulvae]